MKEVFFVICSSWSMGRFFCLLSLVFCLLSLPGCIRVAGTAGYSHIKDDEVVTNSTGFDLDSARLVPKNTAGS